MAIEPGEKALDNECLVDESLLVSVCAGLIAVDQKSNVIRLVHFTTQNYFKRTCSQHFPNAEEKISAACINYLSFNIFEQDFCRSNQVFKNQLKQYPFLDYAANHWGHHARGMAQHTVKDLALDFLYNDSKASGASQVLLRQDRIYHNVVYV